MANCHRQANLNLGILLYDIKRVCRICIYIYIYIYAFWLLSTEGEALLKNPDGLNLSESTTDSREHTQIVDSWVFDALPEEPTAKSK